MSDYNTGRAQGTVVSDVAVDAGLRTFMLGVYQKMGLGLLLSAVLAYVTGTYGPVADLFYRTSESGRLLGLTGFGVALQFAPVVVILITNFTLRQPSARAAGALFWTIVSLIGAGSGIWVLLYTGASLVSTFLLTASAFGVLSLVGYTIKRDLSGFHSFLIMGVWVLVGASVLSMFVNIPGSSLVINIVGGLIFAGLVATQTQMLKMTYYAVAGDAERMSTMTSLGALNLYIAFMNLFQILLSFMGVRRS
ncbi:MAG: Bax inhibitor-1/YccA family protein [Caulobacteraceae bacterium]